LHLFSISSKITIHQCSSFTDSGQIIYHKSSTSVSLHWFCLSSHEPYIWSWWLIIQEIFLCWYRIMKLKYYQLVITGVWRYNVSKYGSVSIVFFLHCIHCV
jgi:hypothetical protein